MPLPRTRTPGTANPTLKPITLSTPPASANHGDLRRDAHVTAITAGNTVSENANPSHDLTRNHAKDRLLCLIDAEIPERSGSQLVERNFRKNATLDYWESGMDLGLSRDMFDSFVKYQRLLAAEYQRLAKDHAFTVINANLRVDTIQRDLRRQIGRQLGLTPA